MPEANYNNLRKDKCPYCGSQLEINPNCGRRTCRKPGCYFTMSKETVESLLNKK